MKPRLADPSPKTLSVRNWRDKNPERNREYLQRYRRELRSSVLDAYGSACACCGEDEQVFLCIDHMNNDGSTHRAEIGTGGTALYRWLVNNDFPEGFQVLCYNCNNAKAKLGMCPHGGK